MRQKSQSVASVSTINTQAKLEIDYQKSIYTCVILRKKFLGVSQRFFYLFPDQIAICKIIFEEKFKKFADRLLPLNSEMRVQWSYKQINSNRVCFKKPYFFIKILKSVKFIIGNHEFEYVGEEKVLKELKSQLSLYVFQTKIQEHFKAISIIDKGSYARVIINLKQTLLKVLELAQVETNKPFAAKCIDQKKILEKKNAMQQLNYEITAMRVLSAGSHPNILKLHEFYVGNENFYLVMELAHGGSLLSVMKKRETLFNRSEIRIIMRQLLEGVKYMHSLNLMHRDLKPENILFLVKEDLNSLKIADFGLAQPVEDHPFLYPKCGTPGYVAPEILNQSSDNAKYGVECDIFSCGVILYILYIQIVMYIIYRLSGESLFDSKDKKQLLEENKNCQINLNNVDKQLINEQEKDLLHKMLEKDPSKRISAAGCLEHQFFKQEPISDVVFNSEDFSQIESEFDLQQQDNIKQQTIERKKNYQQVYSLENVMLSEESVLDGQQKE